MPPSAVVCHLRREVARRVDLLATGTDPHVDGEKDKISNRSHSRRNDFVSSGDGDHQAVDHHTDDHVPPLLVNRPEISESLSGRIAPHRDAPTNRVSADYFGVGPTRQVLGRSIQADRQFPSMKGVGPAPSFGDLYITANKLPEKRPEASSRTIGGETAPSCLKRVARKFPPIRLDKGGVPSSNPTGGPRARAVQFLLRADGGESFPSSAGMVIGPPAQIEMAKLQAVDQDSIKHFWTCVVCGKTNEEGEASCKICGKRQRGPCVAQAHLAVRAQEQDPGVVRGGAKTVKLQQQRPENIQESVRLVSGDDNVRSVTQTGILLRGESGRTDSVRDTTRKFGGPYDASSFAKMRRETEPAVRARLGLTGEIKSLLSVIRRKS